jgi:hypothetical protein
MRLSIATAAHFTGVPERTIRRWALRERVTVDDHGRVDPDEVLELSDLRDTLGTGRLPRSA